MLKEALLAERIVCECAPESLLMHFFDLQDDPGNFDYSLLTEIKNNLTELKRDKAKKYIQLNRYIYLKLNNELPENYQKLANTVQKIERKIMKKSIATVFETNHKNLIQTKKKNRIAYSVCGCIYSAIIISLIVSLPPIALNFF